LLEVRSKPEKAIEGVTLGPFIKTLFANQLKD